MSGTKPNGTFVIAPIKEVHRAVAKIYRAYGGDVRRITDIVRCSVVLNSMVDIDNFLKMLKNVAWVDEPDFQEAMKRVAIVENPMQSTIWFSCSKLEKLKLLFRFVLSFFRLHVLGIPLDTDSDPLVQHTGAFQILRVRNRFAEESPVGGYRDVNIKVKIGFKCSPVLHAPIFVPVEHWQKKGVQTVVCEIQVMAMLAVVPFRFFAHMPHCVVSLMLMFCQGSSKRST